MFVCVGELWWRSGWDTVGIGESGVSFGKVWCHFENSMWWEFLSWLLILGYVTGIIDSVLLLNVLYTSDLDFTNNNNNGSFPFNKIGEKCHENMFKLCSINDGIDCNVD